MAVTQANIDEATMIAKNAMYKLAYELSIEAKHGGNIDCCIGKLKLLWLYRRAISCQQIYSTSLATYKIITSLSGVYDLLINGKTIINGTIITNGIHSPSVQMNSLVVLINFYNTDIVATYEDGLIKIVGPCTNPVLSHYISEGSAEIVSFENGFCVGDNCLSDSKIEKLIIKIKKLCTN